MRNLLIFGFISSLLANPTNPVVIDGEGNFRTEGFLLEIIAQDRTIIDWESFSIGSEEITRFIQPNTSSAVLNRVTGFTPSLIDGLLEANGKVILVNPMGVIVSKTGIIHASEFIASVVDLVEKDNWTIVRSADLPLGDGAINMDGILRANALKEVNGSILLLADSVSVSGTMEAPSGRIEVLGEHIKLADGALIDSSGPRCGGTILVGADFQNLNADIRSASTTEIQTGAALQANATEDGNGGMIVLWGDDRIDFRGKASALPAGSGKGGRIEVSSPNEWIYNGKAEIGRGGELFLDPGDVTIDNFGGAGNSNPAFAAPTYNPAIGPGQLDVADLNNGLAAGTVNILTSAGSFGTGTITLVAGNTVSWALPNNLNLIADSLISIQGDITCTSTGNINMTAPTIVFGNTASTNPSSATTDGNISLAATSGMSFIGGNGGGTVTIGTNVNTGVLNISVASGNLSISSVTSSDNITIGGPLAGPVLINVPNGNFFVDSANNPIITIQSNNYFDFSVGQNYQVFANGGFINTNCNSATGLPSTFNVGADFLCDANTMGGDYEFNFQNSFLTANIGGDLFLLRSSSSDGGFVPLGLGAIFNIGRDLLITSNSNGVSQINSNGPLTLNVGRDVTVQNFGSARSMIIALGILDINAGNNVLVENPSGAGFPAAILGSDSLVDIYAGGSVTLGLSSHIISGFMNTGTVTVIADQNISIGPQSSIGFAGFGMLGSVTLVVDNLNPAAPLIGNGTFFLDPTAEINPGAPPIPVQIFTARQNQNNIFGLINSSPFTPGPFNVDTNTERWRVYYPNAFIGSPFTIFYKEPQLAGNIVSVADQQIGSIFDLIEEFTGPLPFYDDLFCIKYVGRDFANGLFAQAKDRPSLEIDNCPWIQDDNYRKYYPSLQRWGYTNQSR
ncbi:MAG: filamentous hemagglutinin N-terminal domain-containing protein [Parachlamydiales bacterium]|nr:filamentous hemagglutinin N-terminal domain-containing protein [Parachlamydiales bacterium]